MPLSLPAAVCKKYLFLHTVTQSSSNMPGFYIQLAKLLTETSGCLSDQFKTLATPNKIVTQTTGRTK